MELSEFKIRQVIFEIRYDNAFILWDRAGGISRDLTKIWPNLKLTEGTPNQQSLRSEDLSIQTSLLTSHIALIQPSNISQFSEQIEETLRIWITSLEIKKFSRIGTRVIYAKTFESEDLAQKAVMNLGLVKYPEAPFFNHKIPPRSSEVKLLWQDDSSQTQIIVKSEHQEVEVGGLSDNPRDKHKKTADVMLIDIDRATRGDVELSKFRVVDWLEGVQHLIARDVKRILNSQK
ncbi:MAG TPA: hypothetical protein VMV48_08535 [Gallionellaceae bacterium]|nr:hypothetical protein [Gallionellaceae bacterium]